MTPDKKRRSQPDAIAVCLDGVRSEAVEWLWLSIIPFKKVTNCSGDPGVGKSALTVDIAARFSTGRPMPDGSSCAPGSVLFLSAEDGLADTIRPRLEAAGAELGRIHALTTVPSTDGPRPPVIPHDLPFIEREILRTGARLVVFDPLVAFLETQVNSWNDQQVRRVLAAQAGMAERTGAAVINVQHLTKSERGNPIYRPGGSVAFIAGARSGLLLAKDPNDPDRRVLASVKSNLAPPASSLSFKLQATANGAVKIEWLGESALSASALLAQPANDDERSVLDDAVEFLVSYLANGECPASEVVRAARQAGFSEVTLQRAKTRARVASHRNGFGKGGSWMWALSGKNIAPSSTQRGRSSNSQNTTTATQSAEPGDLFDSDSARRADSISPPWDELGFSSCSRAEAVSEAEPSPEIPDDIDGALLADPEWGGIGDEEKL